MAQLIDDVDTASAWIARLLESAGYSADFSPASLHSVDRFIDDHSDGGIARPDGLLSHDLGRKLFALGAYVGEVIRRSSGGSWRSSDQDPKGEVILELLLTDGSSAWPVQRVVKRYLDDGTESIVAYAAALGVSVGAPAEAAE